MATDSSPNIFLTILGILPFLLGVLFYLYYLLIRGGGRKLISRIKFVGACLRNFRREMNRFQNILEGFSSQDPEPFGSLVATISEYQFEAERSLKTNYQRYTSLREQINQVNFSRKYFFQHPAHYFRLEHQISLLERNLDASNSLLSPIQDAIKILEQIHFEIADRCKSMIDAIQEARTQLQRDLDPFLTGEKIKKTDMLLDEWENTLLQQIPVVFFANGQEQTLGQIEKQLTSGVYQLLNTAQPIVGPMVEQVKLWHCQILELKENKLMLEERLQSLADILSQIDNQGNISWKWGNTKDNIKQLGGQVSELTSFERKIDHIELQKNLENTRKCQRDLRNLEKHVDSIRDGLEQIQQLLHDLEIEEISQWLDGAHSLMHNVTTYHPKNWPDAQFPQLLDRMKTLEEYTSAYYEMAELGISEDNVYQFLQTIQQSNELYYSIRSEIASVQTRYIEIQAIEQSARQELIAVRSALQQLQAVFKSNHFLSKQAGKKLERYVNWLETDFDALQNPAKHTIEEIRSRSEGRLKDLLSDLNHWLNIIHSEVVRLRETLIEEVHGLYGLVSMDDQILLGVNDALKNELETSDQNKTIPELVYQLKQTSDLWQRLSAAGRAVQETLGPVMDRYRKTEKFRKKVNQLMEDADHIIPETLAWPPTTARLTGERKNHKQLENKWDSLHQERNRALQVLAILSDLSDGYQSLENQLRASITLAKDEQKKIADLEMRLEASKKEWVVQSEHYQENKSVVNGVRQLLTEIDQEYKQIIHLYQNGAIQYHQAFQGIRQLCRKIDDTMIAIDNQHVIDINGLSQRRSY